MSDESEKDTVFINWEIQYFSSCNQRNGEGLKSPIFTSESLSGSQWCLELYPRGRHSSSENYISCFLANVYLNKANFNLRFKINFLGIDNEILAEFAYDDLFEKEAILGCEKFLKHEQFNKINTNDTLRIQCHMKSKEPIVKLVCCEAYTKIGVDRCKFHWPIKIFGSSNWSDRKTLNFCQLSQFEVILTAPGNDILVEINRKGELPSESQMVECKITFLDIKGGELNLKTYKNLFDTKDTVWKFPLFTNKIELKYKSDTLRKHGMFTLLFQLSASNGTVSSGIEKYTYYSTNPNSISSPEVGT